MKYLRSLTKPPDSFSDSNKWADYLEILCLSSLDKIVTLDEIYDKLYGDKSDDESSVQTAEYESDDGLEEFSEYIVETSSEKSDVRHSKIDGIFEFLNSRQALYKENYPFKVTYTSPKTITLKTDNSYRQWVYLNLLVSSNLDYFSYHKHQLATTFEHNSLIVFKKLFPVGASIEYFGKGAEKGGVFNQSKLIDRIKKLSEVLNIKLSAYFNEDEIGGKNTGDGGLDLVGWFDLFDNNNGKIVNFGQCACGKDWFDKQFDMSLDKWSNYIHLTHPVLITLLTPSSYRTYDGNWYNQSKIYNCIIIDRLRFINSLSRKEISKVAHSTNSIIDEIKNIEISYFN